MLKIFRHPMANFKRDAARAGEVYTADALRRIADEGFNAVWIRTINRELLQHPAYPRFGTDGEAALRNVNQVIERGAACGVRVIAYCQEPMGLPVDDPFWTAHREMGGEIYNDLDFGKPGETVHLRAFCVSAPEVRAYLIESMEELLRRLPGLGAVITITASEYIQHCFSHRFRKPMNDGLVRKSTVECPRCRERAASDIVVDLLNSMRAGMNRANAQTPLIAWNWSWAYYEDDPQPSILDRLAPGIDIMADFERGGVKTDPEGREIEIDEYSLAYVGPSERFMKLHGAARARGRQVYAKQQIDVTHELASVPNVPLVGSLYGKTRTVRALDLAGVMACWNFGNELCLNTRAFNRFLDPDTPREATEALTSLASETFPGANAAAVVEAWKTFGRAFDHYPFCIPYLYHGTTNYALALPLKPGPYHDRPLGRAWVLDPRDPDDDPSVSFGIFGPDEIAHRLTTMARIWRDGLDRYEEALVAQTGGAATDPACPDSFRRELNTARAVYACLCSAANAYRLYRLKRNWSDEQMPEFLAIARDELEIVSYAIPVYEADDRLGYHSEAHGYMVTPALLKKKQQALGELLLDRP